MSLVVPFAWDGTVECRRLFGFVFRTVVNSPAVILSGTRDLLNMHRRVQALTKMGVGAAMIREHEIKVNIAKAISHAISVADLAQWLYSNSWNMHQDSSPSAVALASEIHLLLAERDDFSINDDEFLSELRALNINETQSFEINDTPQIVYSFKTSGVPVRLAVLAKS
jgi:hypothetical protein